MGSRHGTDRLPLQGIAGDTARGPRVAKPRVPAPTSAGPQHRGTGVAPERENALQRLTITLDDATAEGLDAFMAGRGYANRSEAMRDLLRGALRDAAAAEAPARPCMAVVSYIYDHHERDLGRRLMRVQHDHHALSVATLHTHLDHDNCLEVAVLRGTADAVRGFAQALVSERGVRLGGMNLLPLPAPAAQAPLPVVEE
jgi:CopG family nickel-responsive transcriptional regulator